ncbi:hypothetical protein [Paraflavitalea sp. CAU 1676]|uniref:hypothetical protein n=1 Tax=Paraflavitalea sp. CAU 1676 TaxID=3032598 RepID=UPI0023D9940B|nr:hypothetical protein [Paraflavitalea sp. CAU 1676]MDF2187028.1 hypothetical protein [Paraflavitalea sp. CAU 1676]
MDILIFKTNLRYRKNIHHIGSHIEKLKGVIRWNVDMHDKDRILRIEAKDLNPRLVENTLSHAGYSCEELQ